MTTTQTKSFVTAGKAIFTISNGKPAPDTRDYTYKVSKKVAKDSRTRTGDAQPLYKADIYFVSLLTGSDNGSDYTYLGVLDPATGAVRTTAKSVYLPTSAPVVAINWALGKVWAGKELPGGASLQHAGHCGKCARLLTVPESIESGLGPECSGLGYTKPRNVRKPRQPKLTAAQKFEQARNTAAVTLLNPTEFTLGAPAAPTVDLSELYAAADQHEAGEATAEWADREAARLLARTGPLPNTLDLGGLYSDNLAGLYAAASAEEQADRLLGRIGIVAPGADYEARTGQPAAYQFGGPNFNADNTPDGV